MLGLRAYVHLVRQGLVVGFMMRGRNHSYEIQWSKDKCCWHFDFEIVRKPDNLPQIGFSPDAGEPTSNWILS